MNVLPHRHLGRLAVPVIGFGAMVLSPGVYGPVDDAASVAALGHALDEGATFVDTSDAYGDDGHNERIVGRAIAGRSDVVVATKFGLRPPEGAPAHRFRVGFSFGELAVNADPKHVRFYAERSLKNLGRDVIDLYYPHFPDPEVPIEETAGAVAELIAGGLVRHLGLSNVTAAQLRAAHAVCPVAAVQAEWSAWRPIETGLVTAARELGVGIVAWSPLGAGFLTGTVTSVDDADFRRHVPRFAPENLTRNRDRYAPLREVAAEFGISPAQLALAWLLRQASRVVPIPGSRDPHHISENVDAAGVSLPDAAWGRVDAALAATDAVGRTML